MKLDRCLLISRFKTDFPSHFYFLFFFSNFYFLFHLFIIFPAPIWVRYPVWQHTFVSPSADSRRAVVSYWQKVKLLGGPNLPRKSVVRLTDRPDMTLDVYREHKTSVVGPVVLQNLIVS